MRILLLDAPERICQELQTYRHAITYAATIDEACCTAKSRGEKQQDALIIGFEDLQAVPMLRRRDVCLPILGVGSAGIAPTSLDRTRFLESGGDDLFPNGVNVLELIATVAARIRLLEIGRTLTGEPSFCIELAGGRLVIDLMKPEVLIDGNPGGLTFTEIKLLTILAKRPGVYHSRSTLIEMMSLDLETEYRTIDTHVKRIRNRINGKIPGSREIIRTQYGLGYCIDPSFVLK